MIHTVKGFSIVDKREIDVFLENIFLFLSFFLYEPMNVGNLNLWFLCLFQTQLVYLEVLGSHNAEA